MDEDAPLFLLVAPPQEGGAPTTGAFVYQPNK
jgi:hypothetical protein